jgi:hypothetical protein
MLNLNYDTLRLEVKDELIKQDGMYNWADRDTNVRIVEDIRKAVDNIADSIIPSAKHIAEVAIATNENPQIRDFIMGLHIEKDIEYIGEYVSLLTNVIIKEKVVPLATVFCGYLYQVNNIQEAKNSLTIVLNENPNYYLAKQLRQIFDANWLPEMFTIMAQQLHPKVVNKIYEIDNKEINNDNNN